MRHEWNPSFRSILVEGTIFDALNTATVVTDHSTEPN